MKKYNTIPILDSSIIAHKERGLFLSLSVRFIPTSAENSFAEL